MIFNFFARPDGFSSYQTRRVSKTHRVLFLATHNKPRCLNTSRVTASRARLSYDFITALVVAEK